ncbi:type 2 isopentenyl-diphosphate Delta-isomerase [Candidatus Micrarchaeota archaeon]|nr:type 2 isopentenyl-diphosphate Delta-isomerase [Candidatus Micrarchaeota archaeon]
MNRKTESRKADHVRIALTKDVQARTRGTGFDGMEFVHYALPEMDFEEINTSISFLGKRLSAPLFISSMTGGYAHAEQINRDLAQACQTFHIGLGVGSQRAMLEDAKMRKTFQVRDAAPDVFLGANIGAVQLREYGVKAAEKLVSGLEADALFVHLNPLQEVVQTEGDRNWRGALKAIEKTCSTLSVPVIVKETGAGIEGVVASELEKVGVKAIDVSGVGGTSWSAIELYRNGADAGNVFWDWGNRTADCVKECKRTVSIPIIASGGIRSGLDAAKAIRTGAHLASAAMPFIQAQEQGGKKGVEKRIRQFVDELKMTMFLTRSKTLAQLREANVRT